MKYLAFTLTTFVALALVAGVPHHHNHHSRHEAHQRIVDHHHQWRQGFFSNALNNIFSVIPIGGNISKPIQDAFAPVVGVVDNVSGIVTAVPVVGNVIDGVNKTVQGVGNVASGAVSGVSGNVGNAINNPSNAAQSFLNASQNAAQNAASAAQNAVANNSAANAAESAIQNVINAAQNGAGSVANAVQDAAQSAQNATSGLISNIPGIPDSKAIRDILKNINSLAEGALNGVQTDGLTNNLENLPSNVASILNSIPNIANNGVGYVEELLKLIQQLVGNVNNGDEASRNLLKQLLKRLNLSQLLPSS